MIFSILALVALIIGVCVKSRTKSLIVQSFNCVFEAIYDFLIGAYTGAFLSIINFIRTLIFINKDKFGKIFYIVILLFFESIIVINCVFTYQGYISLLPTIGSMIRSFCLWQSNMKIMRISGITTGIFYGMYYLYYHSWFMVIGEIILLMASIYAIVTNDVIGRKKRNEFRRI